MASSNSYQQILDEYPEYITKEQLYQICHISKKSAQNLLHRQRQKDASFPHSYSRRGGLPATPRQRSEARCG